jgi:hypothetical protein
MPDLDQSALEHFRTFGWIRIRGAFSADDAGIPSTGWHLDGDYTGRLLPPCGVLIHAMLTDVIPLQVIDNIASAGDVILMHSLLMHAVPAAHVGTQPRFLLSTSIQEPYWQTRPTK